MLLLTGLKTSETPERRSSFHLTNQFIYKFTTKVVSRRKTKRKNPATVLIQVIPNIPESSSVQIIQLYLKRSVMSESTPNTRASTQWEKNLKVNRDGRQDTNRSGGIRVGIWGGGGVAEASDCCCMLTWPIGSIFLLLIVLLESLLRSAAVQIKLSCGQWGGVQQQQPTADNGRSYSTTFLNTFSDAITGEATLGKTQTPAGDPLRSEEDGGGASQRKWLPPPPLLPR